MTETALIGVDVGATSIKVAAFTSAGRQLALAKRDSQPRAQAGGPGVEGLIWDSDELWARVAEALRELMAALPAGARPAAVAVSGFGADGAPFTTSGEQRYPVISWHDGRTVEQAAWLERMLGSEAIYSLTGYHVYPINTLARWRWLAENAPRALDGTTWLMVPDIVAYRLSGEIRSDPTSASTTMAYDLTRDAWAYELLRSAEIPESLMPRLTHPGETFGKVTAEVSAQTGLPEGTPVVTGGHDCEVGALIAGTRDETAFIDITGTWEILLVERKRFDPLKKLFESGIDWERHAVNDVFLCQSLMPAGSILNWLRGLLYPADSWKSLINDARNAPAGAGGVMLLPSFVNGMGPFARRAPGGGLLGLRTSTTRGQLVRAGLEALCFQLRRQVEVLESAIGRRCLSLRVLGGAQQNDFWLQLKADVTGCLVEAIDIEEATALGAALLAGTGIGIFRSGREAVDQLHLPVRRFEPDPRQSSIYADLYETGFSQMARALPGISPTLAPSLER